MGLVEMKCPICNSENIKTDKDIRYCEHCGFTFFVDDNLKPKEPTEEDKEIAEEMGYTIRTRDDLIETVIALALEHIPEPLISFLSEFGMDVKERLAKEIYDELIDRDYFELFKQTKEAIVLLGWKEVFEQD